MPPLNILGFWNRVTKFLPKFSYNYKIKMSKMNMKIKNNIKEKKHKMDILKRKFHLKLKKHTTPEA